MKHWPLRDYLAQPESRGPTPGIAPGGATGPQRPTGRSKKNATFSRRKTTHVASHLGVKLLATPPPTALDDQELYEMPPSSACPYRLGRRKRHWTPPLSPSSQPKRWRPTKKRKRKKRRPRGGPRHYRATGCFIFIRRPPRHGGRGRRGGKRNFLELPLLALGPSDILLRAPCLAGSCLVSASCPTTTRILVFLGGDFRTFKPLMGSTVDTCMCFGSRGFGRIPFALGKLDIILPTPGVWHPRVRCL